MTKFNFTVIAGALALILSACGGGGGGTATGNTSVTGAATKGPLDNATVCAFELVSTGKGPRVDAIGAGTLNGCAITGPSGQYTLNLASGYTGPLLIETTGGRYCSTETQVAAGACATGMLLNQTSAFSTVVTVANPGVAITSAVNPLTTAAVNNALGGTGGLSQSTFDSSFNALLPNLGLNGVTPTSTPANNTALNTFLANLAAFVAEGNTLETAIDMVEMGEAPAPQGTTNPGTPEPPAETDELTVLQSLEGSYTLKAQDSDALCYGWGFAVGSGNPDPYFTLTVDANGNANLRPHDISRNGSVGTNPPASVNYSPSGANTTLSIVNRSSQAPMNRFLRMRQTGEFSLDFELEETASTLRNFTPQSASERAIQVFVNSGSCTDLFKLIPEVPLFYPASPENIAEGLLGAKTLVFNDAPVGTIPGSPFADGATVEINVSQQTLTIGDEVLSNPGYTSANNRDQYIFRNAAGTWFVLYNDNEGFRINVYGNANPFTEGTTFFGQLQLILQ